MTSKKFLSTMALAALIGVVAIFAVACGGSAGTATTSPAPSTVTTAGTSTGAEATVTSADDTATSADDTATSSSTGSTEAAAGNGSVAVSGLVDHPMTLAPVGMGHMNWITVTVDDPRAGSAEYDGVKLSEVFTLFGVQSAAKTLVVTGSDGSSAEITLADVGSDALLAVNDDDVFNMVMPGMPARDWVRDVVSMKFK